MMRRLPRRRARKMACGYTVLFLTLVATTCHAQEKTSPGDAPEPRSRAASEQQPAPLPSAKANSSDCVPAPSRDYALAAGLKLGVLLPVGLGAMLSLPGDGKVRWQIDVVWEPSNYLQSYSVGGSYHPWDKVFFAGARLRLLQLHAPWSRGFRARTDNQLALGPEIGVRFSFGSAPRVLPFASLGVIFFPSETLSLPPMVSLDIGAALDVASGRLP